MGCFIGRKILWLWYLGTNVWADWQPDQTAALHDPVCWSGNEHRGVGSGSCKKALPFYILLSFFFFFNMCNFINYLFLVVLGLGCCMQAFSSCGEWELLLVAACGVSLQWLLFSQSTDPRHTGFSSCRFWALSTGSVVTLGLSWFMACGIFTNQRSNPYPLHWQADSHP